MLKTDEAATSAKRMCPFSESNRGSSHDADIRVRRCTTKPNGRYPRLCREVNFLDKYRPSTHLAGEHPISSHMHGFSMLDAVVITVDGQREDDVGRVSESALARDAHA